MSNIEKLFIQELITSIAYFAPLTFLAVYLSNHFAAGQIAYLLLIGSLMARGSRIILAPLFDLFRVRTNFILFQMSGMLGYLLLAFSSSFILSLISIAFIGFFYSSSALLIRVLFADIKSSVSNNFNVQYAKLHVLTNIATVCGPFVINLIFNYSQKTSLLIIAVSLMLLMVFSFITMDTITLVEQKPWFRSFGRLLLNKQNFIIYFLAIVLWFAYAQIFALAPILLAKKYFLQNFVWTISLTNSITIVILSIPLNKYLSSKLFDYQLITIALLFILIGFTTLIVFANIYGLFLGILLLSLSEIIFIPALQNIFVKTVDTRERVAIFAVNALLMATGEGLGFYYGVLFGFNLSRISVGNISFIYSILIFSLFICFLKKVSK